MPRTMEMYSILHNIRSAHNVGAIFRTADGAGVQKIFLSGYTPQPVDRFGRVQEEIKKTSLGATESVAYEVVPDIQACITQLYTEGFEVVAVEQTPKAIHYNTFLCPQKVAFIFGNEITGIESEVLAMVSTHIILPMRGMKESLNVSVCAGIVMYHFAE